MPKKVYKANFPIDQKKAEQIFGNNDKVVLVGMDANKKTASGGTTSIAISLKRDYSNNRLNLFSRELNITSKNMISLELINPESSISERLEKVNHALGEETFNFIKSVFPELEELRRNEVEKHEPSVGHISKQEQIAPELQGPPLPEKAPETWKDRPSGRSEDPASFLLRVYEPWLGKGLTRTHIRAFDRPLYNALATHAHRHGVPEELRDFFASPSKAVDEELERQGIASPRDALERVKGNRREAERLYSAAYRREQRGREPGR